MENSQDVVDLVKGIDGLVTLPDIFVRINQLVNDENSTLYDIAKVISQDPGFTVQLLKVANSAFYGFSSVIDTALKAISVIGTSQIRNLALSMSVTRTFSGLPNGLVSMENFWLHSLYCALIARKLGKLARKCDSEALFTAALLHDIGELILFNRKPEQSKEALLMVLDHPECYPVHLAERDCIGFDHAAVGGALAEHWHLPPMLVECIAYHHELDKAQKYRREVAIVQIANALALMAEIDTMNMEDVSPIEEQAWEITGLDPEEAIEPVVREAQEEIAEARKLFLGY